MDDKASYQTLQSNSSSYTGEVVREDSVVDGFHELCTTYSTVHKDTVVADWPPRSNLWWSYFVDWLCLVLVLISLTTPWWVSPPKFYFRLDDVDISFPMVKETIGFELTAVIIVVVPICVVAITQIWVRSLRDFHQSVLATFQLFASTQVVCGFVWFMVGGLRPNFLTTCNPDTSLGVSISTVSGYLYYGDEICTCSDTDLYNAKHSFPSGHAASITAMCIFLMIYLSAKLKLYDNRSHFWKFLVVIALFIINMGIAFSRIRDGRHHFRDVVVGIIIGAIIAPAVYRLNFCSLSGPDNHIPTRYTWRGRWKWSNNSVPQENSDEVQLLIKHT